MSLDSIQHGIDQCRVTMMDQTIAKIVQQALTSGEAKGLLVLLCCTMGQTAVEELMDSLEAIRRTEIEL